MPFLLIHHSVADYDTWRQVHDEDEATRRANGEQDARLFRDAGHPNTLTVLFRWDDAERARLFAESDDFWEMMLRAGVTGQPVVWVLSEVV